MSDARLKTTLVYPDGCHNAEIEVEATPEGLEFDTGNFISWEWIDSAREALLKGSEA